MVALSFSCCYKSHCHSQRSHGRVESEAYATSEGVMDQRTSMILFKVMPLNLLYLALLNPHMFLRLFQSALLDSELGSPSKCRWSDSHRQGSPCVFGEWLEVGGFPPLHRHVF